VFLDKLSAYTELSEKNGKKCVPGQAQLKKMWQKVVLGELSVWALADCKWRTAAPGLLRLPRAPKSEFLRGVKLKLAGWVAIL